MKLRIGSITFLLFLSSVAFPQARAAIWTNHYHKDGKKIHKYFSKYCQWTTNGGKHFRTPFSTHSSPLQSSRIIRY